MGIDPTHWAGKRVFVTGHTGFKGGWLSLWLAQMGAQVVGYSLEPPTQPNLFDVAGIREKLAGHHRGDVLDLPALRAALAESTAEIVIHMAAQSLVLQGHRQPVDTYAVNVLGTVHLLEAVRLAPAVKAVIIVTSDKCYRNTGTGAAYRETDPLGGSDPYSSSKACAELVTSAYRASFAADSHLAIASVRAGNVIGGGDWAADRLIPDCIRAFSGGQSVSLRHPNALRPWQHVLDPIAGYLQLAQALTGKSPERFADAWNIGPDAASKRTVAEVANGVATVWGVGAKVNIVPAQADFHEDKLLQLDSTKAKRDLGWAPNWPFERALDETVRWYRAWHESKDMQQFTLAQIDAYRRESA